MSARPAIPRPSDTVGRADGFVRWRVAAFAFCASMIGVHVAAGLNAAGIADFWRDMYWATSIARADAFPLSGPPIYGLFELGPWWFYVVALPIFVTGRIAMASVLVQLLAAAKYVVAFRIGSRAVDARFGFACSVGLAIAGWSTLPVLFMTHTAVTETMVLLLVAITWRCWAALSLGNALVFGLACAGCLHAHPSTIGYVGIAAAVLLHRHRSPRAFAWMGAAAAVVALTLLPPWLDPATPAVAARSASGYLGTDVGVDALARWPRLVSSLAIGGAEVGYVFMTRWNATAVHIAIGLWCACLLVAGAGALRLALYRPAWRWPLALAAGVFVVQAAFLAMLRPVTPMWMVPSALPALAAVLAIGWYGVLTTPTAALRSAGVLALVVYLVLGIAPFALLLRDLHSIRVMGTANPLGDIIQRDDGMAAIEVPFLSVSNIDRMGPLLCEPGVLHARLATVVENSLGTSVRNACGHWPTLRYGGVDGDGPHRAGLLLHAAEVAGIAPDRIDAGIAWYDHVRAVAPAQGGRPTGLRRMQVTVPQPGAPIRRAAYAFRAAGADRVVLTNRVVSAPMTVLDVRVGGHVAKLLYDDGSSRIYACDGCAASGDASWAVDVDAVEANLDLVVIEPGQPGLR